jgi:hypothetical protein
MDRRRDRIRAVLARLMLKAGGVERESRFKR